jgi:glycosidase
MAHEIRPDVTLTHPEWSRDATIYQINTRQFTDEGTFAAAAEHLPRLAELGVRILWLMPVNPIGEVHRKGTLGSPYAVRDYHAVNPELGTVEDLKSFVAQAHSLGLYVILDWVANHTAWDNVLVDEHPEWYLRDWKGDFCPTPWWDWDDIIDLDYSHEELRDWMADAMAYWVRDVDVDGFRCDVAGFVPTDFWDEVRDQLDAIKPVFMLAEWESRDLHRRAFDMTYGWTWYETMHHIASGPANVDALRAYYANFTKSYPADAMRMLFVSNHDKNSWEGTEFEQFGDALEASVVLSVVSEGMPLVYNGQEAGNERRLEFFEKDPITWRDHPMGELYRRLVALKQETRSLWNGAWGARMVNVPNDQPQRAFSFVRESEEDAVLAVLNLSAEPRTVILGAGPQGSAHWTDWESGESTTAGEGTAFELPAWGWRVLLQRA